MNKFSLLILVCFLLSACSNNYKALSEDYRGQKLAVDASYSNDNSVDVTFARQNTTVTGAPLAALLIVAVIDAAANAHAASKARDIAKEIEDSLNNYNFKSKVQNPTYNTIKKAGWLNLKSFKKTDNTIPVTKLLKDVKQKYALYVMYDYKLPSRELMFNHMRFSVYEKDQKTGAFKEIYKVNLQEQFKISNNGNANDKNVGSWQDNGGALLQKGITETTRKLNAKLGRYLADPHNKQIQQILQQEDNAVIVTN